jgi:hypothetical protein
MLLPTEYESQNLARKVTSVVELSPSYTLKLKSTTAVHGSWKVSPPPAITPSQKDASFSMQDPSMAAAGSEGTVTYHVVVPKNPYMLKDLTSVSCS